MFHTYNFQSPGFQDWFQATNQLSLLNYLELGGRKKDYLPPQVEAYPQDQFLLYTDDEAGVCGSAALMRLPSGFKWSHQLIPQGTWVLRNVFFYLRAGHPLHEQGDKFQHLVERFHLGLFEHLWKVARPHKVALSVQTDPEAHKNLAFFGGFTFQKEAIEEGEESMALGLIALHDQTYAAYTQKKKAHLSQTKIYQSPLLAQHSLLENAR